MRQLLFERQVCDVLAAERAGVGMYFNQPCTEAAQGVVDAAAHGGVALEGFFEALFGSVGLCLC